MVATRQKRAVGRASKIQAEKKAVGNGTARMNEAADKALEKNSEKIATSLLNGTLNGNATMAKLLFALAAGQIDCENEVLVKRLCSLATELEAEPEWNGESTEGTALAE
jgi:hypothetical protein